MSADDRVSLWSWWRWSIETIGRRIPKMGKNSSRDRKKVCSLFRFFRPLCCWPFVEYVLAYSDASDPGSMALQRQEQDRFVGSVQVKVQEDSSSMEDKTSEHKQTSGFTWKKLDFPFFFSSTIVQGDKRGTSKRGKGLIYGWSSPIFLNVRSNEWILLKADGGCVSLTGRTRSSCLDQLISVSFLLFPLSESSKVKKPKRRTWVLTERLPAWW